MTQVVSNLGKIYISILQIKYRLLPSQPHKITGLPRPHSSLQGKTPHGQSKRNLKKKENNKIPTDKNHLDSLLESWAAPRRQLEGDFSFLCFFPSFLIYESASVFPLCNLSNMEFRFFFSLFFFFFPHISYGERWVKRKKKLSMSGENSDGSLRWRHKASLYIHLHTYIFIDI